MLNVEFVSLVWILNHPRNVVVALTLYQNVMVVLEKKSLFSLELFALSHFILNTVFCLTHFYVFFVNILKKVNFSDSKPSPTCDESSVWWKSINSLNFLLFRISF